MKIIALLLMLAAPARAQQGYVPEQVKDVSTSENFEFLGQQTQKALNNNIFPNGICFDAAQTNCQTTSATSSSVSTSAVAANSVSTVSYAGNVSVASTGWPGASIVGSTLTLANFTSGDRVNYCYNFICTTTSGGNTNTYFSLICDGKVNSTSADATVKLFSGSSQGCSGCIVSQKLTTSAVNCGLMGYQDSAGATTLNGAAPPWTASATEVH